MSGSAPRLAAGSEHSDFTIRMDGAWSHLQRQEFSAAHEAARALRASHPGHRDVLFLLAVSLRHLERFADALEALEELERHHPRYGRLFEERGLCHLAQHALPSARTAFSTAVTLNPWLPVSWRALERLYRKYGQLPEAEAAARSAAALEQLPHEIRTAYGLFADGDIGAAEQLVRRYLLTRGEHIEALRLLARIAMAHDVPRDAQRLLEQVLRIAPACHAARYEYARVLLRRLKHLRAREELETLLAVEPDNPSYRLTHATACARLGDLDQALCGYRALAARTPARAEVHLAIGHALKSLGRSDEAAQSYLAAAALPSGYAAASWHLATLRAFRFPDADLERMMRQEADAGTTVVDRYHLCFALGKALEDRSEYAQSFQYYAHGNALRKRECHFRPERVEHIARRQATTCTADFFATRRGWGCPDAAPIFIVGLPRAGSTLIEQILASHSAVEGTLELPNIAQLIADLQGRTRPGDEPRYPGVLAELSREDCRRLGEQYIRDTLVCRHGKPLFIDKCPSNFQDIGFIQLILPNARIIDARRNPIACCFSNFKQIFLPGAGPEFVYDFDDLARYYRMYLELMRHWEAVLPGKILRIQYEELVSDFAANLQRIFEFCALEPEPACFQFHKTERAVHTLSAEQVRRPIDRTGLDQWRRFEPWLGPLKDALARCQVAAFDPPTAERHSRL
ncbi:MAG: tetratricopeptide repeat-containing sulfotransferase family protein [Steroidobacteraceae bacterium]|jgi:tetratricopeptide (TPR) repeat protein